MSLIENLKISPDHLAIYNMLKAIIRLKLKKAILNLAKSDLKLLRFQNTKL